MSLLAQRMEDVADHLYSHCELQHVRCDGEVWTCEKCGAKGTIFDWLIEVEGMRFDAALDELRRMTRTA